MGRTSLKLVDDSGRDFRAVLKCAEVMGCQHVPLQPKRKAPEMPAEVGAAAQLVPKRGLTAVWSLRQKMRSADHAMRKKLQAAIVVDAVAHPTHPAQQFSAVASLASEREHKFAVQAKPLISGEVRNAVIKAIQVWG